MEPRRQREIVLAVVAAAILAVAVYSIRSMSSDTSTPAGLPSASSTNVPGRATPRAAPETKKGPIAEVDLASLNAPRPEPVDVTRNLFRFKPKPPPPPVPAQPVTPQPTGPVEPPPPPRIPLKFFGLMNQEKAGPMAILSDSRGVYYGREGDTIEGRYRIVKIGVESVELAYLDGRGRQTIRLTGQ